MKYNSTFALKLKMKPLLMKNIIITIETHTLLRM